MVRIFCFVLFVLLLMACNPASQLTSHPTEEIVLQPLPTRTQLPVATPTVITATVALEPTTVDPEFFRDEFTGALDAEWTWVRENPRGWSLINVPGSLQIEVDSGYVPAHNNSNLLLRAAPEGDFQIEAQIAFRPEFNFQFAGLIIYESDSNFIQAGRAYCSAVGCVGSGLYMDYYKKGEVVKPDFGQTYGQIDPILIRLSRRGDIYTFEASTDGKVWFIIGSHTSDIQPRQIGLVAGQTLRGRTLPAAFEYFAVRSLP
jgi:beta-xylosidase